MKAATTQAAVRRQNVADRIRMPDGVHLSLVDINREVRPAKVSINAVVLTNNSRAMTLAIAHSLHRRMDGHRHAVGADRADRQAADFGAYKKTRRAFRSRVFLFATNLV